VEGDAGIEGLRERAAEIVVAEALGGSEELRGEIGVSQ
jgi:hypothetical protein